MFELDNKYKIHEECWSVYRKPVKYDCPICKGVGQFEYNGYDVKCTNCSGSGKLHACNQFVLDVCKVKIRKIKASIYEDLISISYVVDPVDMYVKVKNRGESNLFKTMEEAEDYCIRANKKEILNSF